MKAIGLIAVITILAGFGVLRILYSRTQKPAGPRTVNDTYQALRKLALQSSRSKLNLATPSSKTQPWGVVMDWGISEGTATIVAFSDGSASVYLSNGGGYLGGGSHDAVRKAAQRMVAVAGDYQPQMKPTTIFPLPLRAQVIFYVLTDSGVFTASAPQDELSSHRHPLWMLGEAGQNVITQYRIMQSPAR